MQRSKAAITLQRVSDYDIGRSLPALDRMLCKICYNRDMLLISGFATFTDVLLHLPIKRTP